MEEGRSMKDSLWQTNIYLVFYSPYHCLTPLLCPLGLGCVCVCVDGGSENRAGHLLPPGLLQDRHHNCLLPGMMVRSKALMCCLASFKLQSEEPDVNSHSRVCLSVYYNQNPKSAAQRLGFKDEKRKWKKTNGQRGNDLETENLSSLWGSSVTNEMWKP